MKPPGAAGVTDKMANPVFFVGTLTRDAAGLAMQSPQFRIDTSLGIDRCYEDIGDLVVALGMAGFAGERDTDLPELCR